MNSFDTNQRQAELLTCSICRSSFFVTHAETVPRPFICQSKSCQEKKKEEEMRAGEPGRDPGTFPTAAINEASETTVPRTVCARCLGTGYIPSETCDVCVDCQDQCPACGGKG